MKLKIINRDETDYTRAKLGDPRYIFQNSDPRLHPLEKQKEYKRATNAAKFKKLFSKPFIHSITHTDGIKCMAKNPKRLNSIISGTADGNVNVLDIPRGRILRQMNGHNGLVKGVCVTNDGTSFLSCGSDAIIKLWNIPYSSFESGNVLCEDKPILVYEEDNIYRGIDYHWDKEIFITCGDHVKLWNPNRTKHVKSMTWGHDTVTSIKFNPVEPDLFGSTGSDRNICIYDIRTESAAKKLIMETRSNAISWNPMEAMKFVVANEDCNLYTYDMRKLNTALCVHLGFVNAAMDVDFSPTGREFVAGSYDETIKIFAHDRYSSSNTYFTGRMHKVFSVKFSMDGTYVYSGSDDMNIRIWKANASEQLGVLLQKEQESHAYKSALINKFQHMSQIKDIENKLNVPRPIFQETKKRSEMREREKKKLMNRKRYTDPSTVILPMKKKKIVNIID